MLIVQIIILFALIYIIYLLSYTMFKGAPFAALSSNRIETMIELLQPEKDKRLVDLGSGDGRIVIAFAKKGIQSYGYEIIPIIYLWSLINLKRKKVMNAKITLGDYWNKDLSKFDYVAVWGTPYMMGRLEKKLLKELKPGSKVVSNHSQFPNWKAKKKKNDVYLYVS